MNLFDLFQRVVYQVTTRLLLPFIITVVLVTLSIGIIGYFDIALQTFAIIDPESMAIRGSDPNRDVPLFSWLIIAAVTAIPWNLSQWYYHWIRND